jgi:uncharacterized protein YkwD
MPHNAWRRIPMTRYRTLLIIIPFSLVLFSCIPIIIPSTWLPHPIAEDFTSNPDTAKGVPYMTPQEQEVVRYLNLARVNPKAFAEQYIAPKRNTSPAAEECYQQMMQTGPLSILRPSRALSLAAQEHAAKMGAAGKTGHYGTDGSSPFDRIKKYGQFDIVASENCAYGYSDPLAIVTGLLIDEGVPDRGHRKNILMKPLRFVGVGIRPHSTYGINCVQDFAGNISE